MFNYSVSIYLSAVGKQRKSFNNNQSFMPGGEGGGGCETIGLGQEVKSG